ncbi:hypothetical protein EJ05DRAFT_195023 [Pseudovirgaria hyperparasitica]|uniref:Uncharacterized protein n=1 Tax=Pseudovirgaria hyperparasitica TaxID=470096 RepID=A0A6A6WIX3_9PEZI|nr:uncharacterized protein EJ05DRAFT_195023 [Pseudovirgaria hyperparasitica]KAF2762040.1 hypothetical protein EJ05DRAFT_195023 [Pseudovirgaria hyperparasitica]
MAQPLSSRPSSPSVASTMGDDDDADMINTPPPSEPDTFPDYIHVDMGNSRDEVSDQAQESTASIPSTPPFEDAIMTHDDEPLPPYTVSEASPGASLYAASPRPISTSPITQHYDPDKKENSSSFIVPGTYPTAPTDPIPDPPEEEIPYTEPHNTDQNPFIAAATAAVGLSTLLAIFTARTLYTGAQAASSSLYTNFQSDLRGAHGDIQAAMADLATAVAGARREIGTARESVFREVGQVSSEVGGIVRDTEATMRRDVEAVVQDLGRVRGELQNVVREVGGGAVGDLRRTWGDVLGVLRDVRDAQFR